MQKAIHYTRRRAKQGDQKSCELLSFCCINSTPHRLQLQPYSISILDLRSTKITNQLTPKTSDATIKELTPPSRFLQLPSELRIKVYKELLSDFTGNTSPVRAAILSCRQLNHELSYEMPSVFHANLSLTILSIQTVWDKAVPLSALRITLLLAGTSLRSPKVGISIPKSAFLHPSAGTDPLVSNPRSWPPSSIFSSRV
jgi:hypothetical protein